MIGQQEFNGRLGAALRARRRMLGLTLQDVAARVGFSYQQVQKYESGANAPSVYTLFRMAEVLQLQPEELLIGLIEKCVPALPEDHAAFLRLFAKLDEVSRTALLVAARVLARGEAA